MPLLTGKSKKVISKNIGELISSKPGKTRAKGIKTYMENHNCDYATAKRKMAIAAAMNKAK